MEELRPPPPDRDDPEPGGSPPDDPGPRPLPGFAELVRMFPVTAGLTAVTGLMFLVQTLVGTDLLGNLRLGAVRGDLVARGDLYRLLCAVFLHAAWWHFAINWFAFLQLAGLTEYMWGSWRLLAVYLASGVGSSLLSAALHGGPVPSVGSSGAILGLAGLLLGAAAFGAEPSRSELRQYTGRCLPISVGFTFLLGIVVATFWVPIVDNWAHFGGFATGFLFSLAWRHPRRPTGLVPRVLAVALTLAAAGSLGWMAVDGADARRRFAEDLALRLRPQLEGAPPAERLLRIAVWIQVLWSEQSEAAARQVAATLIDDGRLRSDLEAVRDPPVLEALTGTLLGLEHPLAGRAAERWVEVAPQDPQAKNALAWFLVTGPTQARSAERALELSRQSLELAPTGDDPQAQNTRAAFLDTQAEALLQLGRPQEALPHQEEAVAIGRVQGHPELPDMAQRLQAIQRAIAAVDTRQPAEADGDQSP